MKIIFTSQLHRQSQLHLVYPKEFIGTIPIEHRTTSAATEFGNLKIEELWFEGVCLLNSYFNANTTSAMTLQCDSFCWVMNFALYGDLAVKSNAEEIELNLQKGRYHTFYCSALNTDLMVNGPAEVFTICLTQRFIRKLLGKQVMSFNFEGGGPEPFTLVTTDEYYDGRFKVLIQEMIQAGQPDYIRRIFLEGKILELLSMQLERLENKQLSPGNFSKEDISRLEEAKNLVAQNLQTPCSLIELARKTGLNDFKLKKGFKELFGHTVFGYLSELRMNSAYQLLKEGKTVSEVSEMVGYKNAHHFTSAFKKRYNFLPSRVGKMMILVFSGYAFSAFYGYFCD